MPSLEEALQYNEFTAVLSEMSYISFKELRRFQLAAEKSRVISFALRHLPIHASNTIVCLSRWCVTSIASKFADGMPGKWMLEWSTQGFIEVKDNLISIMYKQERKTG